MRQGYQDFLEKCYEEFTVAFFSSTTQRNAGPILKKILTPFQKKRTLFFWYRDRTALDPNWKISHPFIKIHSTIKPLWYVWDNPIINENRKYSPNNTLICDDSLMKLRLNHPQNCITVDPYLENEEEKDVLANLWNTILDRFELLNQQLQS
jgi:hypothetical protein